MWHSSWRLDLEAMWALRQARRVVRERSVRELVDLIDAMSPGPRRQDVDTIVAAYRRAVHGRFGRGEATCLPRAFGLTRLLRSHGHGAVLVIGVRPEDLGARGLEHGHAWVEIDGQPVDEPPGKTDDYHEFLRAPGRSSDASRQREDA